MKVIFNLNENDMMFAATMISYEGINPDDMLARIRERIDGKDSVEVCPEILTDSAGKEEKQLRLAIATMGILSLCKDIIG